MFITYGLFYLQYLGLIYVYTGISIHDLDSITLTETPCRTRVLDGCENKQLMKRKQTICWKSLQLCQQYIYINISHAFDKSKKLLRI